LGEDVIDPAAWAGSVPRATGIAPRVRVGRNRWFNLLWLLTIGFVLLIVAVAVAKGLRGDPAVQRFIARYPGTIKSSQPGATGFPGVGAMAALLQPVLHGVHHSFRRSDLV
jgi:methionine sulfoxide reductase catalytic subunit